VKACPFGAISLRDRKAVIDYDRCTLCGACAPVCRKYDAIELASTAARTVSRRKRGEVWVFCEQNGRDGGLAEVSVELLGCAQRLAAELGVPLAAVLVGQDVRGAADSAVAYGADRVYAADSAELAYFDDERYSNVLARLIRTRKPEILLGGATAIGRALLPRVAVLVHAGLTADCTELELDSETGLLRQTRPAFGGNILATIVCESRRPQMATVRPGVLQRPEPDADRRGEIVAVPVAEEDLASGTEWVGFDESGEGGSDLREAEIIVSAGYGTGGPDGVVLVARLARALGASLGASRSVVDAGWLEYPHQVGQTGTTVQPRLYVACGISGAIQHIVGMQNSDTIVAINRDADAPIFQHADFALVGDLHEIIPELLRQLGDSGGAKG
jgi:electron transfer flavoprotein alpha subunit